MGKLTPEERAEFERKLKEDDDAADEYEVEIGKGDSYARVPYGKARKFLQEAFGIDLDAEPKQEGEGEGKPKGKQGGEVRAFGRRVG